MGNSVDSRTHLLAKNWTQITASTYKNTITDQLIDAHQLHARNEEQLAYNNSLLIKRAGINHPNVVKLIYFYEEPHSIAVCNNKKYKHRIYTERASYTLATMSAPSELDKNGCYCCSVMNGIACLVDKYGYFGVNPSMIFFVNAVGLSKSNEKKIVKVWINQDLRINHTQLICNQQEMCHHLGSLFGILVQKGFCNKSELKDLTGFNKFKDFFQHIYSVHKKMPSNVQAERKRIVSQYSNLQESKVHRENIFTYQNHNFGNFNPNKITKRPTNDSSRQSLLQKTNTNLNNLGQVEQHQSQWTPQQKGARVRRNTAVTPQQALQNLFLKGENQIKEVDLQQNSSHKLAKNKINFSYTDSLATPKHNKSFQFAKTTKLEDSPFQQPSSLHKQQEEQVKQSQPRKTLPVVSFFNFHPNADQKNPQLQQSPIIKHKQIVQTQPKLTQQPLQQNHKTKQQQVSSKPSLTSQIIATPPKPSTDGNKLDKSDKPDKTKKESNLKLQRTVEMQCNIALLTSSKSITSIKQHPNTSFEIVSEYRFSFEPNLKIPNICREQSYAESIDIPSRQQLKEKSQFHTSKFYKQSQPQIEQSVQSQKYTFDSNHLAPPSGFKPAPARKGSLPAPHYMDNKYNTVGQKLEHLSKGITNSINSIHSKGTKQSIPANSQESQESSQANMGNEGELIKFGKQDNLVVNNCYVPHYSKRQSKNKRSSELESYYSESDSLDERKKVQILQKITNTQKILEQNKKKLQKLQMEKDLQLQKDMIKKEMQSLLKNNNMIADESHRIKEKVRHKKATFAELKAEASKILNDLNL